jgi:hypothetical protein
MGDGASQDCLLLRPSCGERWSPVPFRPSRGAERAKDESREGGPLGEVEQEALSGSDWAPVARQESHRKQNDVVLITFLANQGRCWLVVMLGCVMV